MTGNNVDAHLDEMQQFFDQLKALITPDKPLTADDIYSASLLISLPDDWLPCVLSLMNEAKLLSAKVVTVLKAESLRHKSRQDEGKVVSASKAKANKSNNKGRPPHNNALYCTYCKRVGHDLKHCQTASRILNQNPPTRRQENRPDGRGRLDCCLGDCPNPADKAGNTTVVRIGGDYSSGNDLDYSNSEVEQSA
jgi:hypothetical protein